MLDLYSPVNINDNNKILYLCGTASYGQTFIPKKINSLDEITNWFGYDGSIPESFNSIKDYVNDLELYYIKITGTHAKLSLNVNSYYGEIEYDGLIFTSRFSHEHFNETRILIEDTRLIVVFPISLGGGSKSYYYSDYITLSGMINAINKDTDNGENCVYVTTKLFNEIKVEAALVGVNQDENQLVGGSSGIDANKNQLYFGLQEFLGYAESLSIDAIVPLECYIDDTHIKAIYGDDAYGASATYTADRDYLEVKDINDEYVYYHKLLIEFCNLQKSFGLVTHAIMGINPLKNFDNTTFGYVQDLVLESPINTKIGIENDVDGSHLSVVACDILKDGNYTTNGYIDYAGLLLTTNDIESTTNKPLIGDVSLVTELSDADLFALAKIGAVTFRNSELLGRVVVHNGITLASNESDFHFVCNVRMIQKAMHAIKVSLKDLIGQNFTKLIAEKRIEELLESTLNALKTENKINEYHFLLHFNEKGGILTIELELKTIFMIETIKEYFNVPFYS